MEALNFVNEFTRMCGSISCEECKVKEIAKGSMIARCDQLFTVMPEKMIEVVETWSTAHPNVSKGEKLKEVFGDDFIDTLYHHYIAFAQFMPFSQFLNEPYVDPTLSMTIKSHNVTFPGHSAEEKKEEDDAGNGSI